jgi:hypothetical protein
MSNGKPCEAHNMPVDICARCTGAAEEYARIMALLDAHMERMQNDITTTHDGSADERKGYAIGIYMESHRIYNMISNSR